jgi:voltage-gated potassium channel
MCRKDQLPFNNLEQSTETLKNHIVIFGWDYFVKSIVEQLVKARQDVLVITNNHEQQDILNDFGEKYKPSLLISSFHDHQQLAQADIQNSRIVLVNLQDDTKNLVFVLKLKRRYPGVRIVVPIDNAELRDTFVKAGITYSLSRTEIGAKLFASHLFEKHVATYLEDILASGGDDEDEYDIQQYLMIAGSPLLGDSYQDAFLKLKKEFNAILIGISKLNSDGTRQLYKNPYGPLSVETTDFLIVIINGPAAEEISAFFGVEEGG